ncbi:hypothetical protein T08_11924 [Trichinella sp. T8]|nr:hypothetical protein T08_11924 [Trichinella sp. T8]
MLYANSNVIYKDIQYTTVKVSNQQASSILPYNIIYNKRVSSVFQFDHIPLPHDIKQHIVQLPIDFSFLVNLRICLCTCIDGNFRIISNPFHYTYYCDV